MKSHALLSGINRHMQISGLALLQRLSGIPFPLTAQTLPTKDGPLDSWNEGPVVADFVRATTDQASSKIVPPEQRIATFDQDGTLWVEHPVYSQVNYWFKTVLSGNHHSMISRKSSSAF